jgi:tetratricopeptide (TPR) repeat protein
MAHWAKTELKRNDLEEALLQSAGWVRENRRLSAWIAGGIAATAVVISLILYQRNAIQNASWEKLNMAEAAAYAGRPDLAVQGITDLINLYPGTRAAGFGLLFSGDLSYWKGDYAKALEAYSKLYASGRPSDLLPFALADQAASEEALGRYADAARDAQTFLDSYPDQFLAPQVHSTLAHGLLAQGKRAEAKAAYQRIVLEYSATAWANDAQQILKSWK